MTDLSRLEALLAEATLRTELETWATRTTPWTGAASMTAEDGYNAAIEEVVAMLNYPPARNVMPELLAVVRAAEAVTVAFDDVGAFLEPDAVTDCRDALAALDARVKGGRAVSGPRTLHDAVQTDPLVVAWRAFSDRFMDPEYRDDPKRMHIRDAFAAGWDAGTQQAALAERERIAAEVEDLWRRSGWRSIEDSAAKQAVLAIIGGQHDDD